MRKEGEMKKLSLLFGLVFAAVLSAKNALAYSPFLYIRPEYIINNFWFKFSIVFVLFYAVMFYSLNRVFAQSRSTAIVVSVIVSLMISAGFVQQGFLDFYTGSDVAGLLVLIGFLAIFGFIFRVFYKHTKPGAFLLLFGLWFLLFVIRPEDVLPYFLQTDLFLKIYGLISGWAGFVLLMVVAVISIAFGKKKKKVQLDISH